MTQEAPNTPTPSPDDAGRQYSSADQSAPSAPEGPTAENVAAQETPEMATSQASPTKRKIYSSISWSATVAMFIFSLGLLLKNGSLELDLHKTREQLKSQQETSARAERVLDLLTEKNAQHATLTSTGKQSAAAGTVVYAPSTGGLILLVSYLAPLPPGKACELWVEPADGKAPISAGLFQPDRSGKTSFILPALPGGVRAKSFLVTVEDASGAETPSASVLLAGTAN